MRKPTKAQPAKRFRAAAPWAVAAVATGVAVAALAWGLTRPAVQQVSRIRFVLSLPDSAAPLRVTGPVIALSPDGSRLAFMGGSTRDRKVFLRALDGLEVTPLRGTEGANRPTFSPDGKWVAFTVDGRLLKKVPIAGGPAVTIADSVITYSWGDGDVVVISSRGRLWRTRSAAGAAEEITRPDTARGESSHGWPHVLPGGKGVVFTISSGDVLAAELAAVTLDDRRVTYLGIRGVNPRYLPTGHLVWGRADGSLAAAPFDPHSLRLTGPAVTVMEDVVVRGGGATEIAVSRNGLLAYLDGRSAWRLVLVDRSGRERPVLDVPRRYGSPRLSPDGKHIAVTIRDENGSDVWIQDISSGTLTRLTTGGRSERPAWTADGRRVVWTLTDGSKREIRSQRWDGSGESEVVLGSAASPFAAVIAPTGGFFAYTFGTDGDGIGIATLDSARSIHTLLATSAVERMPTISPDGRWVGYSSNESGRIEVYVRLLTGQSGRHQISADGGAEPVWSPAGGEIFYRVGGWLMSATVETTPEFRVVRRDTVLPDSYAFDFLHPNYDVSRDGSQFLMSKPDKPESRVIVVTGWLDELRERMALAGAKR